MNKDTLEDIKDYQKAIKEECKAICQSAMFIQHIYGKIESLQAEVDEEVLEANRLTQHVD